MAVQTGTASDHLDLWNKLLDFLHNDSTLTAAGQNWTTVWTAPSGAANSTDLVLKGPGLAGQDEVYVALRRTDDTLTVGESLIWVSGCSGVEPNAVAYTGHVNSLARPPAMFLDHAPMGYWFVANGRRFIVIVKMSTVYNAMYAGLFLPYATPDAYGYPLFIGGSRGYSDNGSSNNAQPTTWRTQSVTDSYRHFIYPVSMSGLADTQASMLDPQGTWRGVTMDYYAPYQMPYAAIGPRRFPYNWTGFNGSASSDLYDEDFSASLELYPGYRTIRQMMSAGLDGEWPLTRATLMTWTPAANSSTGNLNPQPVTYGVLDGCYSVPGINQSVENTITANGVDHLVVQNVSRTAVNEYWALALE